MGAPAQGNQVLVGFGAELGEGIRDPAATLFYLKPILPFTGRPGYANSPGGEVNQSGFAEKGVPGPVTGALDLGSRFSVPTLFHLLKHFCRDIVKSEPETDVFQYVMTPDPTLAEETLFGLFGMPPVDVMWQHGIKFSQLGINIGNNNAIPLRVQGQAMHFSRLGAAVADGSNTGTWAHDPVHRGPLADPTAGNLFLEVTALSPLRYKVQQAAGTTPPTMAGSTVNTQLYDENGDAIFVPILSDTGAEIGVWGENKDPSMICVPGTAADHANIDVGDVYYFPVDWDLPTPTFLGGQRFTSAHQQNYFSVDGGSTYIDLYSLTTAVQISHPLALDQGSSSRYPFAIDRNGQLVPTVNFTRKLRDRSFREIYEASSDLKLRTYFLGQLLEGGPNRESIKFDWARMEMVSLTDPAQNDNAIVETIGMRGITDDAVTPPFTATLITDQDYPV